MTEAEKRAALASIAERAAFAERNGLPATAKLWREFYWNVITRDVQDIIMAASRGEVPQPE